MRLVKVSLAGLVLFFVLVGAGPYVEAPLAAMIDRIEARWFR